MSGVIPAAALEDHVAILGKTGSGKSNGAKTVVEAKLDAGERVCVIDPTGTWYGLRLLPSGKGSAYKILIFGGHHADVQISGRDGAAIAEVVGTSATSCIIDTRLLSVTARTQFFTDFAEGLLRHNQGKLTLVVDEAHLFAPQGRVNDPRSGAMVGAANNLVSLGRGLGLRIILISQRPAKLHKDSLTQVETLVAMRLIAPQDRGAVQDWIKEAADIDQGREIMSSLASMPTGDAWVWSPALGILERRHFPLARTMDTGQAQARAQDIHLDPLEIEQITERLEAVAAEVLANDPKHLKAEVARLAQALAKRPTGADLAAIEAAHEAGRQEIRDSYFDEMRFHKSVGWRNAMVEMRDMALKAVAALPIPEEPMAPPTAKPAIRRPIQEISTARAPSHADAVLGDIPHGCAKPLAALAAVYPSGLTEAQWALAAGFKRTGGTWGAYKGRMRKADLVAHRDGRWFATAAGAAASGDVERPPPPGPDLVRWWAAKLRGTPPLANALIEAWPDALNREELAARVGMTASGGTFSAYLGRLAGPGLIVREGGTVRLSAETMGA